MKKLPHKYSERSKLNPLDLHVFGDLLVRNSPRNLSILFLIDFYTPTSQYQTHNSEINVLFCSFTKLKFPDQKNNPNGKCKMN